MRRAALDLVGRNDYRTFANHRGAALAKNAICAVSKIAFLEQKEQPNLLIDIVGDRFLYKMVHNLIGTLIEVGLGKRASGEMAKLLDAQNRAKAGIAAPAHGLTLVNIAYGREKMHAAQ